VQVFHLVGGDNGKAPRGTIGVRPASKHGPTKAELEEWFGDEPVVRVFSTYGHNMFRGNKDASHALKLVAKGVHPARRWRQFAE